MGVRVSSFEELHHDEEIDLIVARGKSATAHGDNAHSRGGLFSPSSNVEGVLYPIFPDPFLELTELHFSTPALVLIDC